MLPSDVVIGSVTLSIWNATFLVGICIAYVVFSTLLKSRKRLSCPLARFLVVVYLSALAAQAFAYAFDANGSIWPPPNRSAWSYYFNPLAGPKTLYGVILMMPLSVAVAIVGARLTLAQALDLWTVPMLVILSIVRIGCLLQGCCHGVRSELLGVAFPIGASIYWKQRADNLISAGAAWSLPVIPTQAIEAAALAALGLWTLSRRHNTPRDGALFMNAVMVYSAFRFTIEFVRDDFERGIYGPLATSQWIALGVLAAAASVAMLWKDRTKAVVDPQPAVIVVD